MKLKCNYMEFEELIPLENRKTLSNLNKQEFELLLTSKDPAAVEWRRLHKKEFAIRQKASILLNEFFKRNSFK